ncbi:hypothetical protein [Kitasatospora sp. NPDC101183]|uniref:hypothetical protein n=1 Tax=Kitasatospora sp. NPDC101183 TaxID=3364100 RepID=UPI0038209548
MTRRSPGSTAQLRQGTQDLLERRGMATDPGMLGPQPGAGIAARAAAGPSGADAFRHGGRDAATTVMHAAPSMHAELKGHRHRGAEKHSAH